MVGCDDTDIVLTHSLGEATDPSVKFGQRLCVARDVVAVTEHHIKINEVGKAKSCEVARSDLVGLSHTCGVVGRGVAFAKSLACKNIIDLTNRNGGKALFLQNICNSF